MSACIYISRSMYIYVHVFIYYGLCMYMYLCCRVRGVTILASSGDDGAVSPSAASNSMYCGYNPSFPATSPYVTAVGGTMVG